METIEVSVTKQMGGFVFALVRVCKETCSKPFQILAQLMLFLSVLTQNKV
jgi:hypothetical protein